MKNYKLIVLGVIGLSALVAQGQTISYGNLNGDTVLYQDIRENSSTDPGVALYGVPSVAGDSLVFSPAAFGISTGNGTFDMMDGTLMSIVKSINNSRIEKLQFTERGDYTLGGSGSTATSASVSAALFVRVTEIEEVSVDPITTSVNLSFSPSDGTYNLIDDPGQAVIWNGSILVDIDAMIANAGLTGQATRLDFSIDNSLMAFSEPGTLAYIKKKQLEGFSVTAIVPEPATLLLLLASGLFLRRRA